MSKVRVLVGTRKGAFILTSDGKREKWDVSGPHFAGLGDLTTSRDRRPIPNRLYASQSSGWFGQLIQRSNDGGKTWEPVGNKFVYDGVPGTHQWYDGTPHPWEFKRVWHLEPSLTDPDTVYAGVEDAALFRSTDGGKTWQELSGLRGHGSGSRLAAGRRRHVPAHHHPRSERSAADFHRHLGRGRLPHRRRRQDLEADQPGTALRAHPRPDGRGRPLRSPHRHAPVASRCAVHAEALGRHAQRRRRRFVARGQRKPADRLRVRDRRSRARAGDHLRRPDQERLASTFRPTESCACTAAAPAETSGRRSPKVCRKATATSTCCATRWPSTRWIRAACISAPPAARFTRPPMPETTGRPLSAIFRPCFPSKCRRWHNAAWSIMIRVILPAHLRTLAQVRGEVELEVGKAGDAALGARRAGGAAIRCCAARIRDHVTQQRRPFLRFFACEEDLSHESPDAPLPDAVASGAEPFLIVGAIAGG